MAVDAWFIQVWDRDWHFTTTESGAHKMMASVPQTPSSPISHRGSKLSIACPDLLGPHSEACGPEVLLPRYCNLDDYHCPFCFECHYPPGSFQSMQDALRKGETDDYFAIK